VTSMSMTDSLKLGKRVETRSVRVQLRPRGGSRGSAKTERVAALASQAFSFLRRGREANVEAGRIFNEIKRILGHGRWKAYFRKTFAPCGVIQRTAQNYMAMARKADADLKKENFSFSQAARDPHAQSMRRANEKAKSEVAIAAAQSPTPKREPVRRDGVYKLPLFLTVGQQNATDELRKSSNWPAAEKKIVSLLNVLCAECGGK
jgi:hypothetical protein